MTGLLVGLLLAAAVLLRAPGRVPPALGPPGRFCGRRRRRSGPADGSTDPAVTGLPGIGPAGTGPTDSESVETGPTDQALVLDLLAAALSAGLAVPVALRLVGDAVGGPTGRALRAVATAALLGADGDQAWRAGGPATRHLDEVRQHLEVLDLGGSAVLSLRAGADSLRKRRRRDAQAAAGRLGVLIVLPLGLCGLPAFVALGVVPVVMSLLETIG